MRKKMTGMIVGALMMTLLSGTTAFAAANTTTEPAKTGGDTTLQITMEDAAAIALKDAKVKETDVVIYEKVWKYSDNTHVYDISFLIPGQSKYEYEIETATGRILENDKENWDANDDTEYKGLTPGKAVDPAEALKALKKAEETALQDAGVKAADVVVCKRGSDFENGRQVYVVEFLQEGKAIYEYDIAADDGTIITREQEPWEQEDALEYKGLLHPETVKEEKSSAANAGSITNTRALEIALKDAGLTEADVTVTKCHVDIDDGAEQYEVEFRTADGVEYEYEIDAASGKILDKDVERDDD